MNPDRVGEFLNFLDHPCVYHLGMEHESAGMHKRKAWVERGLEEACAEVFGTMECVGDLPKYYRFTCGYLSGTIQIDKDELRASDHGKNRWGPLIKAHLGRVASTHKGRQEELHGVQ